MIDAADFAHRLERLLAGVAGVTVEPKRIALRPPVGGLPIVVHFSPREISVELTRWRHVWSGATDDDEAADEALDLVAAAAFGHARVRVHARCAVPFRWDVEFRLGGRWSTHASVREGRGGRFWRRASVEILVNPPGSPPGVALHGTGRLPYAPWVGMLDAGAAPDAAGRLQVDGVLDLHPFSPRELVPLVRAYIDACLDRGITQLRIIHGKGIGNLRRSVHALLERHPAVAGYRLGGHGEGAWGATIVDLRAPDAETGES